MYYEASIRFGEWIPEAVENIAAHSRDFSHELAAKTAETVSLTE